jgi:hypothetical protein
MPAPFDPLKLVTVPLPRAFGWLLTLLAWEVVPFRNQLEELLEAPDLKALLAASPRAVRAVRPLCRMLGLKTPRPRAPVPPVPPTPVPPREPDGEVARCDVPHGPRGKRMPRGRGPGRGGSRKFGKCAPACLHALIVPVNQRTPAQS